MNRSSFNFFISRAIEGFVPFKTAEGLSRRTIDSYLYILERWNAYTGDMLVTDVATRDITNYLAWLRTDYQPRRYNGKTNPHSFFILTHHFSFGKSSGNGLAPAL